MYLVRKMKLEDIEQVHSIEESTFPNPWSEDAFTKEITINKHSIYMVIEEDNNILAYAGLWNIVGEGYITNIAVKKDRRGAGLGRKVTEALIEEGRKHGIMSFTLEVRISNKKAIKLYKKLGFEISGVRKNFYEKPREDAYIMWK
ncbi:ribosomal-protein-alanine acetyltransferase [Vallitalea longa]|uniref:[Ribosomal protein bS18]-alanine N-acetyltransferase n=1 Tax=Vallitalea longa TaxID=2936439 RepID=A0A9W5YDS0_9FIRM|nr:ribosomal protein S18-alanine N-acetyltransferase [Vallitalea longa]GKX30488.1 ribosomal-protein-alanine acetyltransferase [Vallitalea longa]